MTNPPRIRAATPGDLPAIESLLEEASLPRAGLPRDCRHFFVAEAGGATGGATGGTTGDATGNDMLGAVGLEAYGTTALLRSLVVRPGSRSHGIGDALTRHLVLHARRIRVRHLYLITTSAAQFFLRRGFIEVRRSDVSGPILASEEFTGACPASAAVMLLRINPSILILCTGNSCRSQMAEGILRSLDPSLDVQSAGTAPAARVHPYALRVMQEAGIPLTGASPKNVSLFLNRSFDHVITVCDSANESCPLFTGEVLRRHHMGFPDPAQATGSEDQILAEFRRVRDAIRAGFERFVREECQTE